ncbi:MAG: phenylalanine--tRNA ligase subunit beta [Patescibacteria group bacterium]
MNIKIPVSWLREYLKTDTAAKTIAAYLTSSGPSVERIEKSKEDYIFDVEVTTNRPDAYSVFGLAREANAILLANNLKSTLNPPKGLDLNLDPDTANKVGLDVLVTDYKLCPRFTAIVLEIKLNNSPAIIKNRLEKCGIRPINNIVDITNYIMLETGQPMHAFDYDKIEGAKMMLRESRVGEKITTLDAIRRDLPKGTIVIQDAKKLIDLCGIMGGQNSQITNRTKRVVFFVQSYNPVSIRRTTQALAFRTDASARFEKGVGQESIKAVLSRAVYLAKKTAKAKVASELIDIYPNKQEAKTIRLQFAKLNKYLGIEVNPAKAIQILTSLGFKTTLEIAALKATPPSWRTKDTIDDVDLIEEVARIYGYHNLPSVLPTGSPEPRLDSILTKVINLKSALKLLGLTEAITYSIISKELLKTTGIAEKDAVELTNPLTEEWQFMRPTILPSLLDVISKNQNLKSNIAIFEIAKTFDKQKTGLPTQDLKIAFALQNSNFAQIKGLVENLFETVARKPTFSKFKTESTLAEKSQGAFVSVGDKFVGGIGMLKSTAADYFGLDTNVAIAELNLTTIYNQPPAIIQFRPIPKFPPVIEDISAIYSVLTPLTDITHEIKKASTLVKKIEILDIFTGPKLGEAKKSVTLRLTYQMHTGTPTQAEVNRERTKITKTLETNLRAKVRK